MEKTFLVIKAVGTVSGGDAVGGGTGPFANPVTSEGPIQRVVKVVVGSGPFSHLVVGKGIRAAGGESTAALRTGGTLPDSVDSVIIFGNSRGSDFVLEGRDHIPSRLMAVSHGVIRPGHSC